MNAHDDLRAWLSDYADILNDEGKAGEAAKVKAAIAALAAPKEAGDATVNKICRMLSAGDFPHLADELAQAVESIRLASSNKAAVIPERSPEERARDKANMAAEHFAGLGLAAPQADQQGASLEGASVDWPTIVEGLELADQFFDGDEFELDDGETFPASKVRAAYKAARVSMTYADWIAQNQLAAAASPPTGAAAAVGEKDGAR